MAEPGTPGLNRLIGRLPAPTVEAGRRAGGSGTAFSVRNVLFPQMTALHPQWSGGHRSSRRRSKYPLKALLAQAACTDQKLDPVAHQPRPKGTTTTDLRNRTVRHGRRPSVVAAVGEL